MVCVLENGLMEADRVDRHDGDTEERFGSELVVMEGFLYFRRYRSLLDVCLGMECSCVRCCFKGCGMWLWEFLG